MKGILLAFIMLVLCTSNAKAKLVQILHTNDLHSYFDHTQHYDEKGGYARLKAVLDREKAAATATGIPTIIVDAGDFAEGSIYYMSKNSVRSYEALNKLGYDIATIGNHDYLMGTDSLDDVLRVAKPKYKLLGANFYASSRYKYINKYIKPYTTVKIDGIKIAFLGLTTNEFVFKWRVYNGGIDKPVKSGLKWEKRIKKAGADIIIGLTHIGLKKDKKFAKKSKYTDLIIGGHSHTVLKDPVCQKNKKGRYIPIVQTGEHAAVVGRLLLDISKAGIKRVVSYDLIPVENIEPDPVLADFVDQATEDLENNFGADYLYEHVGYSHLKPGDDRRIWNAFITDAVRESTNSDVSVHTPSMSGSDFPIGAIRRFDLYNSHPRWFDFNDDYGWFVYRAKVRGYWIRLIFSACMNLGIPLTFSGITFKWKKNIFGKYTVSKLRIKGKRIKYWKKYEFALPEGIVRGGYAISPLVGLLLKKGHRTPITVFDAMEAKLRRDKEIDKYYLEGPRFESFGNKSSKQKIDRVFFPGIER